VQDVWSEPNDHADGAKREEVATQLFVSLLGVGACGKHGDLLLQLLAAKQKGGTKEPSSSTDDVPCTFCYT
jgi:hypothetical protein